MICIILIVNKFLKCILKHKNGWIFFLHNFIIFIESVLLQKFKINNQTDYKKIYINSYLFNFIL
jgi:hypothetical protein